MEEPRGARLCQRRWTELASRWGSFTDFMGAERVLEQPSGPCVAWQGPRRLWSHQGLRLTLTHLKWCW